jgi:catechol 2,3-dioxygenase-like lactoylglutathione lyase family enzyme
MVTGGNPGDDAHDHRQRDPRRGAHRVPPHGVMSAAAKPGGAGPSACRIARFGLIVTDIERAERFFAAAFGFTTTSRVAGDSGFADLVGVPGAMTRQTHLRLGGQELVLVAFDLAGRPYPPGSTSSDLWFQHLAIIVADIDAAQAQVRQAARIMPITEGGPIRLPCASGGARAFKFRVDRTAAMVSGVSASRGSAAARAWAAPTGPPRPDRAPPLRPGCPAGPGSQLAQGRPKPPQE